MFQSNEINSEHVSDRFKTITGIILGDLMEWLWSEVFVAKIHGEEIKNLTFVNNIDPLDVEDELLELC